MSTTSERACTSCASSSRARQNMPIDMQSWHVEGSVRRGGMPNSPLFCLCCHYCCLICVWFSYCFLFFFLPFTFDCSPPFSPPAALICFHRWGLAWQYQILQLQAEPGPVSPREGVFPARNLPLLFPLLRCIRVERGGLGIPDAREGGPLKRRQVFSKRAVGSIFGAWSTLLPAGAPSLTPVRPRQPFLSFCRCHERILHCQRLRQTMVDDALGGSVTLFVLWRFLSTCSYRWFLLYF